jgi:hypothetical protein
VCWSATWSATWFRCGKREDVSEKKLLPPPRFDLADRLNREDKNSIHYIYHTKLSVK